MTPNIEEILAQYADQLIDGRMTIPELMAQYQIPNGSEAESLLTLAVQLEAVLVKVAPSPEFVAQLRHDLLSGSSQHGLARLRSLSAAQVGQLAAGVGGVTMVAGVLFWYWSRRERLPSLGLDTESIAALA
jgi:hypothetical protein